ncbi:signal transduction histidine kinase [Enterococcus sp. PF1-24]|uniref:sensor histidine kinase n=1 Tax=unclassified Enterococcus TaxID=2608891 RepID=UPI002475BDC5|nr:MULTISPECIES: HAMP domain-containing sensor histidine kinase [unclassified Enterococcus]MDH6364788.1 signal transduction histidine kinase [Enterococcus sp. PFB1-1]MDH6401867.1 signal transduction histidine kinase [Enterococcus sp. PF1-24]
MILICGLLLIIVVSYLTYLLIDIRSLKQQLTSIGNQQTNQELQMKSNNPFLKNLVQETNQLLREKKQLQQAVTASKKELDQAINNISHDLRTPLTVAMGYTQFLEEQEVDAYQQKELLKKVVTNLTQVEERLELLLDYNRLSEGRYVFELEQVSVTNVVEEALLAMYEAFVAEEFELLPTIQPGLTMIADKNALTRIVQNLLGNMLLHGVGPGEVILQQEQQGGIQLIAKNQLLQPIMEPSRLTERFYTEDLSRKSQNSGLGLYIIQELVTKLQGKMEISVAEEIFEVKIIFEKL